MTTPARLRGYVDEPQSFPAQARGRPSAHEVLRPLLMDALLAASTPSEHEAVRCLYLLAGLTHPLLDIGNRSKVRLAWKAGQG